MLLTSPLSSPLKNPVRDVFSPAGSSLSLTAQVQALFASRAGGMWDMGDIATLFQDTAGSTPVTAVTQPIGIVLDKSRGLALGTEVVHSTNWNGGYTTNGAKQIPTGWFEYTEANVASATVLPNSYQFTATAHLAGIQLDTPSATVIGKFNKYTIRARKTAFVSGTPTLQLYTGAWQEIIPSGAAIGDWYTKTIYALATGPVIICSFTGSASWEVEYLTVRELPGNHATQPTAGSRSLFSARKNLLTKTEQFSDGAWLKLSSGTGVVPAVTDNYGVAPDGTTTAARVQLDLGATPATAVSRIFQGSGALGAGNWRNSLWVKTADGSTKTIYLVGSSTLSENVFVVNSAWQQLLPTEATAGAYAQIQLGLDGALAVSNTADLLVWHPQVELGTAATTYQRVNTSSDYDTVGFPAFAQFDATDDALLFPTITFGGAFNTFVAGKVTSGTQGVHLWRTADVNGTWAKYKSGDATTPTGTGSGSPTYAVNGTALSPSQQGQLYTQINGVDSVVESIGVVLTAETALQMSGFAGSLFTGNSHRVLMISGTLTAGEKLLCRQWCAEGNGVTVV